MNPNTLFLHRCDQMAILLESHKEAELLDLAGILRQLLFDEKALANTVNTSRIKLEFQVSAWRHVPGLPTPMFYSLEDGLDPETSPPGQSIVALGQSEFGKYPVTYSRGHAITVKDVIRYASNVAGGVHHDPKPRPEYDIIHVLSQRVAIGGLPLGIRQLRAISRVTLRALAPLIEDVKGQIDAAQIPSPGRSAQQ